MVKIAGQGSMLGRAGLQLHDTIPEPPHKLLLLSTHGKGFQVENDICCISHPKAVCDGTVTLPLILGGFLHAPICVCLHPKGQEIMVRSVCSLDRYCPVSLANPICFSEIKGSAPASHRNLCPMQVLTKWSR